MIVQILSSTDSYKAGVLQYADQIMDTLLRVFASNQSGVLEEGMLAVGAFSYGCGKNFAKYMPAFYPYLKLGLMNHAEWQVRHWQGGMRPGGHSPCAAVCCQMWQGGVYYASGTGFNTYKQVSVAVCFG